jgi:small subunit ribosomal protein S21
VFPRGLGLRISPEHPRDLRDAGDLVGTKSHDLRDQALKILKKKMQREGVFREMKRRKYYEKPSERSTREKAESIRRARKLARKQAQREGLIPMKPKPTLTRGPGGAGAADGAGCAGRPHMNNK